MRTLEIFSGAGGLAKGLELAGFEPVSFIEFNKHACNSLRANFDPALIYEGKIEDFNLSSISEIELVAGGPPCQPFSLGGKHQAEKDNRDMFPYAVKCISQFKPKAFIFENVKGLLRASFRVYFDYIILSLTYPDILRLPNEDWTDHFDRLKNIRLGNSCDKTYSVKYALINAANYGVPQKRERVFIVGIRSDIKNNWQFPEPTHSEERLNWEKYVTGEYWSKHHLPSQFDNAIQKKLINKYGIFPPNEKAWLTIRDYLNNNLINPAHPPEDHKIREGAKIYPGHSGSYIDNPSKTIKAGNHGVPGGENMVLYEDGSVRYLTIYEAKLIQTFPSDFVITGSWSEAMRQIGNAVPVKLSKIIGESLFKAIQ